MYATALAADRCDVMLVGLILPTIQFMRHSLMLYFPSVSLTTLSQRMLKTGTKFKFYIFVNCIDVTIIYIRRH
jgi:hypothetical protein